MGSRMVWPLPAIDHPLKALEDRLKERYRLKETKFTFAARDLSILSIADLDELLEQVVSEDDIPFWAELWPSAVGLLSCLDEMGGMLRGNTVLELGCGTGLVGIAVQLDGGILTQSDFVIDALRFSAVNASRNGLLPAKTLQADWRSFSAGHRYQWIIGSDILYEKKLHPFLKKIFREYLEPGGHLLLSDPGRAYAIEFMAEMTDDGWSCEMMTQRIRIEDREHTIDVYCLERAVLDE